MGGSILPVTIHNNKIYFLFGKERDIDENPGWSDFGGGSDKGETLFQTAIREGGEEMTGFLGSSADIKKLLNKYGTYNIDYKSEGYTTYRCHIFPMNYDDKLPFYYNNNQQFLQKRLDQKVIRDTKIFEKTQIKWFAFDEIKKDIKQFRSFYQNIVHLILGNKSAIEGFVHKSFKKTSTKRSNKRSFKRTRILKTRKHKK
jgi:8-oxo-dGTP pyrophosphatase MutT (NUDIX family)